MLAAGFSDDEVRRLLRVGDLTRVRRGSYVVGPLPEDPVRRHRLAIIAAVRALADEAVVSHVSAAVVHGLPVWNLPLGLVHVTRSRATGGRRGRIVHVHTHRCIPTRSCSSTASCSRPSRARWSTSPAPRRSNRRSSWWTRRWPEGSSTARRWQGCCCGPPAGAAFRRRGERSRSANRAPQASVSRAAGSRSCAGLPQPVLQWEVRDGSGHLIGRTDFGWPALGAVGEFDGEIKYGRLLRPGQSPGEVVFAEKVREDQIRATNLGMARWVWHELGPAFGPAAARIRAQFGSHTSCGAHTHARPCV
jgi:hypothetical protein